MEGREKLSKFELMKEKERKEAREGIQGRRVTTNGVNCGLNGELYKLHVTYTQWCTGCTCSNALEVSMTLIIIIIIIIIINVIFCYNWLLN